MSFHTPTVTLTARKRHICTNCAEPILPGDQYKRWASFDDCACTNKMHPECLDALTISAEAHGEHTFEYTLHGGERPKP